MIQSLLQYSFEIFAVYGYKRLLICTFIMQVTDELEGEERARGAVSMQTYYNYAKAGLGSIYLPLYLLTTIAAQVWQKLYQIC